MAEFNRKQLEEMQNINRRITGTPIGRVFRSQEGVENRPCFYLLFKNMDGIRDEFELIANLHGEMAEWVIANQNEEQDQDNTALRSYVGDHTELFNGSWQWVVRWGQLYKPSGFCIHSCENTDSISHLLAQDFL